MEGQVCEEVSTEQRVRTSFRLGSETYLVQSSKGRLSEQLVSMKEESMSILKDFITRNNVPNDVPDEVEEFSSEDDVETNENVPVKSKKPRK